MSSFLTGAFELKLVKDKSQRFAFSQIKEHQIDSLLASKHTGFYYKIVDSGFGSGGGTAKKPFDFVVLKGAAWVVICFWESGKKKMLYIIDIDDYINATTASIMKSFREVEVAAIATMTIDLTKRDLDLATEAAMNTL